MGVVRWGLVSTANINRRLIPAIRASKQGQLVAVASRNLAKSQAYAKEWEIPQSFGSYEEMLASAEVDAVYISLPNHLHAQWSIRAMEAGKHVLCEKPFATSVEEVDRMTATSRQTGRVLQEAFMYRHHPQTKLVGEWLREGRLGEIRIVRSAFSFFMAQPEGNVRMVPDYGGGALWDVGIYPISFAQFVYGQLPETAAGQRLDGETGVDESFAGQLAYSGGRSAQIFAAFNVPYYTHAAIHGSLGRLTLTRPFTGINEKDREILFTPVNGKTEKLKVKSPELYLGEVENMNAAILEGAPTLVTHAESRDHIRTACALYEAARKREIVQV